MTASDLKKRSFESIKGEIGAIEKLMTTEADNGQLRLITDKISDAAKVYFTDKGFKLKIHLEPGKEVGTSTKMVISWE